MYYKNIFYFYHLNKIGGVETMFYELAKKYSQYDITIFYSSGDQHQIDRLKKYVRVEKWDNQDIECENAFFNYNISPIDHIKAKKYYVIIHADYKALGVIPKTHDKIDEYLGVSQAVCDSFTAMTGLPCSLCYNPLTVDKPKKVLNLVSATRLTKEKGKDRIIKLANALDEAGIPFIWTIFTNDTKVIDNPSIAYMEPRLDISSFLANADYVVQLSDTESYCYTMMEALCLGTPVIVVDWPCLKELGVTNDYGFILSKNLDNLPLDEIYHKRFNFTFTPKEDNYEKLLDHTPSSYQEKNQYEYLVQATEAYTRKNRYDQYLGRIPQCGETWWTTYNRMEYLNGDNPLKTVFATPIDKRKITSEDNNIDSI